MPVAASSTAKRDVRDQMVDALRRELMGPWHPEDETDPSEEFPTARYIVGRLAPQDLKIDDVENEGGGKRNWIYRINDKPGDRSFGIAKLEAGDTVLWSFETYR